MLDPTLHDPGNIFLKWEKEPINVLVVKKLGDDDALLIDTFAQLCQLLVERFAKVVFVEEEALRRGGDDELTNLHAHPAYCRVRSRLRVFEPHCVDACIRSARCSLPTPTQRRMSAGDGGALNGVDANNPVDFVISVGGECDIHERYQCRHQRGQGHALYYRACRISGAQVFWETFLTGKIENIGQICRFLCKNGEEHYVDRNFRAIVLRMGGGKRPNFPSSPKVDVVGAIREILKVPFPREKKPATHPALYTCTITHELETALRAVRSGSSFD